MRTSDVLVERRSAWARLRHAAIERMGEADVQWRALAGFFAAGGLLAIATLFVPAAEGTDTAAIAVLGSLAIAGAGVMTAFATRLPSGDFWLALTLAFGTALVTGGVYWTHAAASPYAVLYVWVAFEAFFFLRRRTAVWFLVYVGASYALALALVDQEGSAPVARWMMLMGTVAVAGLVADLLQERANRLIGRLSEAALTDPLTGLLNRRGFEEMMDSELRRADRSGQPVSLLIGDLDRFKSINDRFGHHEGDAALTDFSRLVTASKRSIDGAARIGGEEFALVLPSTDEHGAFLMAERLRRRVRDDITRGRSDLTVSFGMATYPRHGTTTEALLRNADQALYLAKRLGRDRSVIYSAEVDASLRTATEDGGDDVEQVSAVLVLAETLDMRDTGTSLHSQTVGRYAEAIATELGFEPAHVERMRLAGLLHDIGKIGVPDPILRKPGALTESEWAEMRKHPELGAHPGGRQPRGHQPLGPQPPRASRRQGLPRRPRRRRDPARGAHPLGRGRLRGDDLRPGLPPRAAARRGVGRATPRDGLAVRRRRRARVHERDARRRGRRAARLTSSPLEVLRSGTPTARGNACP